MSEAWLPELQAEDQVTGEIRKHGQKLGCEKDANWVLQWEALIYMPEIIINKLISGPYENPLADHFRVKKTSDLLPESTNG